MENGDNFCDDKWTGGIAVGGERFIGTIKIMMGGMAVGRLPMEAGESFQLRETQSHYIAHFGAKKHEIDLINTHFGD